MAAFNLQGSAGSISHDNGSGRGQGGQQLPTGACGFRDLSTGQNAPSCGCKSFWLSSNERNGHSGSAQMAWCFCGHHACFHDPFSCQRGSGLISVGAAANGALGKTPSFGKESQQLQPATAKPAGLGIQARSLAPPQSINTRLWDAMNAFARGQEDGHSSSTTSKMPSTACPSVAGEEHTPASLGRVSREEPQYVRHMGPPVSIPCGDHNAASADEYSATEAATPSIRGTPDLRAFTGPNAPAERAMSGIALTRNSPAIHVAPVMNRNSAFGNMPGTSAAQPRPPKPAVDDLTSDAEMRNMLRLLSHRVECLESMSFSHVPVEVVEEKFELHDGRLLDLEQWRTDAEQHTAGPSLRKDPKRGHFLRAETDSFSSDGSFDSTAAAHTEAVVLATLAANSETRPRIDALERRVNELEQTSPPSFANPWHIQVVVLPWGRALRGVWFSALDATQRSLMASSQEWTGAQSATKAAINASASATWTTESIEAWANDAHEWLSPKACGPNGMVFQRLASRGLVQDVTLTAPDSRHILSVLSAAFRLVLDTGEEATPSDGQYQALSEFLAPLRKVRKSSRLRFLSPGEMVTSAIWNAGFLDSSVLMKVNDGQRRLYVTTPDAYVQANIDGWSWQTLKQLPLHDAGEDERVANATGSAIEACWAYNDGLDQPISTTASFAASQGSCPSLVPQDALKQIEAVGEAEDETRPYALSLDSLVSHRRTVSLPSSASALDQQRVAVSKRRVASFETTGTLALHENHPLEMASIKRRRISYSPEAERRGVGFTPRMSREPPSPYTSEPIGEPQSQGNRSRNRGMTPFAYATPHSNSNVGLGRMEFSSGEGDTEPDTDIAMPHTEDEWQGVGDGPDSAPPDHRSANDESEIDEENPHGAASSYAGRGS